MALTEEFGASKPPGLRYEPRAVRLPFALAPRRHGIASRRGRALRSRISPA